MKLNSNDRPWHPEDRPDYLCVLTGEQIPPRNRELFLERQAELLDRLVSESGAGEQAYANQLLQDGLPLEFRMFLPSKLLNDPETPRALLFHPAAEGGPLHEWKVDAEEVLSLPAAPPEESRLEAEQLSLESFLARLL